MILVAEASDGLVRDHSRAVRELSGLANSGGCLTGRIYLAGFGSADHAVPTQGSI
jgi:hypothetical protein